MYWYPQVIDYYPYSAGDFRQMPAMPMPMEDMERMRRMMERHMATSEEILRTVRELRRESERHMSTTNEVLGIVRDNNRMLRAVQAHLTGLPPREPEARDSSTEEGGIAN